MEWKWVINIEEGRETEGEMAGPSEGERESEARDYVVGETSGCDTFVYDPGKQSANDFQHNCNWLPFLKDCRYMGSSEVST